MLKLILVYTLALSIFTLDALHAQQCHFRQVSSKTGHSAGIAEDGKLYGWGANTQGQLGIGNTSLTFESAPKLVNQDTDWKKVETGNSSAFSVALKNNGSLWFLGNNSWGADAGLSSSINNYLTPTSITPSFMWKDFSTGFFRVIGIKNDNTLWGWGNNDAGCLGILVNIGQVDTPTQIGVDNDWSKVSCGLTHTLALKSNGTIWACGYNNVGQLGNGSSGPGTYSDALIQVGSDNDWAEILAGAGFSLAIKSDGTLWAWGLNETSQLGDGTTTNQLAPIQIGADTNWKSLGYSGFSAAAIKIDGTLWTWGLGAQGQLGNGSTSNASVPTQIGVDNDWLSVGGGGGYGFAGTTGDHYLALKQSNELYSWGVNQSGALGSNDSLNVNIPTTICNTVSTHNYKNDKSIKIFPNPANNKITVESNHPIKSLALLNVFGQVLQYQEDSAQMDIPDLPNGTYSVQIVTQGNHFAHRLIIVSK